jgi:tripartite-type tricarboxylate transporter receptor subunit TctC
LIGLAKTKPGKYSYASAGIGSEHHLAGEMFCRLTGLNLLHVPYKGFPPTVTDLMAGNVDVAFGGIPSAIAFVKSGQLKALWGLGMSIMHIPFRVASLRIRLHGFLIADLSPHDE